MIGRSAAPRGVKWLMMEANDVVVGVITELMLLESELLTLLSSTVGLLVSVEMSIELVVIYFLEQVGTYHPLAVGSNCVTV